MYLRLHLPTAATLGAGTYWLAWSAAGTSSVNPANTPYKVLPGRVNPTGQMSRTYYHGSWFYNVDSSQGIGLNMIIKARGGLTAGVAQLEGTTTMLTQNVPNPFANTTTITYTLPGDADVKMCVYNIMGQAITTLADGHMTAGIHQAIFDATNLPAGNYYYRLSTAACTESRQMTVVK